MSYQVILPAFEGPLDLLLHLIDTHKLDIYNIPIAFITGQYIDFLKKAEEVDLNLSGDFLVMAGTLLAIKAKMLLPKRPNETETEEEDPRDELVEKLLEYRLYKENAQELKKMETSQTRIYYREVDEKRLLTLFPPLNPIGDLQAIDLQHAFQEVFRLMAARAQTITIYKDAISLQECMSLMLKTLSRHPEGVKFTELLDDFQSVIGFVTAFLALLELLAKGQVWVRQTRLFGEIFVYANQCIGKEEPAFESIPAGN